MVLSGNIGLPVMLILCLFYVVVIYIHVAHTGYFLAARKSSKMMKSEEDAWWREESQGLNTPLQPDMIVFTSPSPVPNGTTFQNGRQNLETQERIETDEGVEFHITLTTQGLLWDEDIVALLQNFPTNNLFYPALIRACIQLQFTQLNIVSEPNT